MNTSGFKLNIAVVIGINDYKNGIPTLGTARQDAEAIATILKTEYQYQVQLITDTTATPATSNNLKRYLETELPEILKQEHPSRLLFYFAGHGIALNDDDGPQGYLIPQDAKLGDVSTYLPMQMVEAAISKLSCRHCLVILDCCCAGAFRWSSTRKFQVIPAIIHQERYDRFIQDPAWQVIASAASDQYANDSLDIKDARGIAQSNTEHSPFAAALMDALSGKADAYPLSNNGKPAGDGVITASELYMYLRDAIEPATIEHSQRQTPGIWPLKNHDKGEYIFLVPGHPLNLPLAPPLDESKNPYRGLESFEEEHSAFFFGRTASIDKLYEFVSSHPLTVVLGASGSGKSSLVKAGLVPFLKQKLALKSDLQWQILAPFRPGESPLKTLNHLLAREKLAGVSISQLGVAEKVASLSSHLEVWSQQHPDCKLLLVIDQFEELITLCKDEQGRSQFLALLAQAVAKYPQQLRLVLTLRSDFEPQFRDTALQENWQASRFVVAPMTRTDLREAIEKPAEKQEMYFEPHELVEELIDEVAYPPALPLLSFGLSELYLKYLKRQRQAANQGITIDRALTQADYQEMGGVVRSLTQRADEEYLALEQENPAYAQIIRQVMLRMVAIGGGELARRRVPLSELEYPPEKNGLVKEVKKRFTNARLLVEGQDAEGKPYIEPAHDALVRGWWRLLTWKQAEAESLILQRRLTPAAEEWHSQQQVRFLWNTNPRLDLLAKVLNADDNWLNQVEAEFVRRSVGRKNFNDRRNWSIAIAVMLGLFGLTIWALNGQWKAQINQIRASRQSSEANLRSNQEFDALIESLRAGEFLKQPLLQLVKPDNQIQNQLQETLQKAVYQVKERNRLKGGDRASGVIVSFSPKDGQLLATAGDDGTVRLWNLQGKKLREWNTDPRPTLSFSSDGQQLATAEADTVRLWSLQGKPLKEWKAGQGWLAPVSFSPNGQQLATTGDDGIVRLWSLQGKPLKEQKPLQEWNAGQNWIWNTSFSPPDGRQLATVGQDGTVRLWDLQSKQLTGRWKASQGSLRNVSFSPNGQQLATTGDDGIARLWNLQGKQLTELKENYPIGNVSFSPDGQQLATVGENGTVGLWNLQGQSLAQWKGSQGPLTGVSFSLDGQLLATGGSSDTVSLWDLRGQPLTELKGHQEVIENVSFSLDGQRLTTVGLNGTVGLWDLQGKQLTKLKSNHKIISVSFSPDGQRFASVGEDGTARVWDLQGQLLKELKGNDRKIVTVSFSLDGQQLATVEEDGTARLWDLATGQPLKKFSGKQRITSNSFSSDGQLLATIEQDDYVHLWDWQGQYVAETPTGHRGGVSSFGFSPDTKLLATAGIDGFVRVWKLKGQKLELFSVWQTTQGSIWNLQFSPNGQQVATAGDDGTVRLWNLQGQPLATWKVDRDRVLSIAFSPDNRLLATVGSDGKVKLLPIESFDELMKRGCDWARDYLQNNPDVSKSDKHLCDGIGTSEVPKKTEEISTSKTTPVPTPKIPDQQAEVTPIDPKAAKEISELKGHQGSVRSVTFSPKWHLAPMVSN